MTISNGKTSILIRVINIIWVLYYTIIFLMKTKSRILLFIKSKVTAKYRNCP